MNKDNTLRYSILLALLPLAVMILFVAILLYKYPVITEMPQWLFVVLCASMVILPPISIFLSRSVNKKQNGADEYNNYTFLACLLTMIAILLAVLIINRQFFVPLLLSQLPMLVIIFVLFLKNRGNKVDVAENE